MKQRMRISKGGQISIPASVRKRWQTSTIAMEDCGGRLIIEPAPDDPIAAAQGALAAEFGHVNIDMLRRRARTDEEIAEQRGR